MAQKIFMELKNRNVYRLKLSHKL